MGDFSYGHTSSNRRYILGDAELELMDSNYAGRV